MFKGKKTILAFFLIVAKISFSQEFYSIPKFSKERDTACVFNISPIIPSFTFSNRKKFLPQASTGIVIGETTFDRQTNASVQKRIVNHGNGTLSAVWTMSHSYPSLFRNAYEIIS